VSGADAPGSARGEAIETTNPSGAARCWPEGLIFAGGSQSIGSTPRRARSDGLPFSGSYRSEPVLWNSTKRQSWPVTSRPVCRGRTPDPQCFSAVAPKATRPWIRPSPRAGAHSVIAREIRQSRKFPERSNRSSRTASQNRCKRLKSP
jgi:hypothetical protein